MHGTKSVKHYNALDGSSGPADFQAATSNRGSNAERNST